MLLNSALISLFLSTPSARRATGAAQCEEVSGCISIHALREEGDQNSTTKPVCLKIFLSTPSARRATPTGPRKNVESKISIHALREEGDPRLYRGTADAGDFYPRPPRGGRLEQQAAMSYNSAISIHALREEGDARTRAIMCLTFTFLSTPSARRATTAYQRQTCSDTDFYPRPPRGGRRWYNHQRSQGYIFLSTPSARRATQKHMQMGVKRVISIHALREEGDLNPPTQEKRPTNFYPRPPRGGRPSAG